MMLVFSLNRTEKYFVENVILDMTFKRFCPLSVASVPFITCVTVTGVAEISKGSCVVHNHAQPLVSFNVLRKTHHRKNSE